ncbi:hypothetical protein [Pseudoalteromonas obscura]|uniref:Uncharacterized protein n=1 Tax=Pseudoalteromonas obscura TaxID=3048491 RepID=A0ABT7EUB5_9GAMM|nr:hypothetical protein [Pseudoalteromonas sp. P94(2023)]MDK2598644.1 hypothetical protein [Pseudoalteromonas sp. P94(2023)]
MHNKILTKQAVELLSQVIGGSAGGGGGTEPQQRAVSKPTPLSKKDVLKVTGGSAGGGGGVEPTAAKAAFNDLIIKTGKG